MELPNWKRLTPASGPLARLGATATLLCAFVFIAPFPVASTWSGGAYPQLRSLQDAVSTGLVGFWASGGDQVNNPLAPVAEFWFRFHLVKAVLAAALLVAAVLLLIRVWRAAADAPGRGRRWAFALIGVVTTSLATLALLVLVANVQGAVAPLSSVLGVLPLTAPSGQLADTVGQIRHSLALGEQSPAGDALLHDFTVYHAVMVALGALVTTGLVYIALMVWRRRRRMPRDDPRWRRLLMTSCLASLALGAFFALTAAANFSTAVNPAPALLGFFAGGL